MATLSMMTSKHILLFFLWGEVKLIFLRVECWLNLFIFLWVLLRLMCFSSELKEGSQCGYNKVHVKYEEK